MRDDKVVEKAVLWLRRLSDFRLADVLVNRRTRTVVSMYGCSSAHPFARGVGLDLPGSRRSRRWDLEGIVEGGDCAQQGSRIRCSSMPGEFVRDFKIERARHDALGSTRADEAVELRRNAVVA